MSTLPRTASQTDERPTGQVAFITGCGRSGTTILGRVLAQHPDVSYLNDRFEVWVEPLPVTDIWGRREMRGRQGAADVGVVPRIALTAEDARKVDPAARGRFNSRLQTEGRGRRLLIEKLAINNFRLGFIMELCPQARLINIVRHGVEVARSIERKAQVGHWYGQDDRKWLLLCEHARAHGYEHLLPLCEGPYERGLLEWRMSVEAADAFLRQAPPAQLLQLTYEELLTDSIGVCARLEAFLELKPDAEMRSFCSSQVRRQHSAAHDGPIPRSTGSIAGETLRRLGYTF